MATGNDIIARAMRSLGALGRLEVPSAAEATQGLEVFNSLLESFSNENLLSYVLLQISHTLTINQQEYTIGSGGDINVDRPLDIQDAFIRDSSNLDYPMRIIPRDVWNDIGAKQITSQIPDTLFYDSTYPLGRVYVFPKPLIAYTLYMYATTQQLTFASLTQTLAMPVGYERLYISNLAVEMAGAGFPMLLDEKQWVALVKRATDSKANVKGNNIKDVLAEYDSAIVSRSYASYNIYSDGRTQ